MVLVVVVMVVVDCGSHCESGGVGVGVVEW